MTMPDRIWAGDDPWAHGDTRQWTGNKDDGVGWLEYILVGSETFKTLLKIEWRKGYQQGLIDAHEDAVKAIDDHNREEHGDA